MTWLKDSNTHLNKSEHDSSKSDKSALLCDDDIATSRYVKGFSGRVAVREKHFAAQSKKWTKANDDFEYNV